jgi:hypothetical protein
MANFIKSTDFSVKDDLVTGDPDKRIKGVEIDDEFDALAIAIGTKADLNSPAFLGTPTAPTASPGVNNTQLATTAFATTVATNTANNLFFPAGTKMLFQQTAAPTGWTKDTTHDNKALRVVSGTASSGGTSNFTTAFGSRAITGTVANHTLTVAQMPLHGHPWITGGGGDANFNSGAFTCRDAAHQSWGAYTGTPAPGAGTTIGGAGGSQGHNHGLTINNLDMSVQYVDLIIATKN